tara:strand:+ start:1070 stop:1252 length:183 start_codon:yes stop_codon:yes gene_type:complete
MNFTNKKVKKIEVKGELVCYSVTEEGSDVISSIPPAPANTDYAEMMRLVEAGELTIEEAE